jgi:hypothetical protein
VVGVLPKGFVTSHPHSGEVMSVTRSVVGHLRIGGEEPNNVAQEMMHSAGRLSRHRSSALPITRGKFPAMWSSLPLEARAAMLYILSHILGSERPSHFSIAGLKSLGYLIVRRHRENAGKLLTAPGLADRRRPSERHRGHREGRCLGRTWRVVEVLGHACFAALLLGRGCWHQGRQGSHGRGCS